MSFDKKMTWDDLREEVRHMNFADELAKSLVSVQPMPEDAWEDIKLATLYMSGGTPYHNIGVDKCELCLPEDKEHCNGCVVCKR